MQDNMIILNCKYLKFLACTSRCFVIGLVDSFCVAPMSHSFQYCFNSVFALYSLALNDIHCIAKNKKKCIVVLCNFKLFADLLYCDFKVYVSQQSAYRCAAPCIERIKKIFGGLPFNCTYIPSPLTKHLFCKSYILNVVCLFHFQKTRV